MKLRLLTISMLVFVGTKVEFVMAQATPKTMLKLPDTGQTGNFTATFGEDADYTINPPFFIKNNNGTVIDTVTGLMWQQADSGEMTIENATVYADTLTLGGFLDWRLPTAHEAFSILNHQRPNPALDINVFTTSSAEYWWTSTRQANDPTRVWCTNGGGGIGNHLKTETISAGGTKKYHLRAVRSLNPPNNVTSQFTDNGDGTISDNTTNLVWQKVPNSDTITWEQALIYAENLTLGGFSDWRLPNIKELQSINDERLVTPSVSTTFFPNIGIKKYWSSTSLPNQTTKAWYLSTQYGITTYEFKTARLGVLCVRGNTNVNTAIYEQKKNNIIISATNPIVNNVLHFKINENVNNFSAQIIDLQGQIIWQKSFDMQTKNTDLEVLLPFKKTGIFILKIENAQLVSTQKILIL